MRNERFGPVRALDAVAIHLSASALILFADAFYLTAHVFSMIASAIRHSADAFGTTAIRIYTSASLSALRLNAIQAGLIRK